MLSMETFFNDKIKDGQAVQHPVFLNAQSNSQLTINALENAQFNCDKNANTCISTSSPNDTMKKIWNFPWT